MKILYETKDTLFITELSLKEIEDIKNSLSEPKPKKISSKTKAQIRKEVSEYIESKIKRGKWDQNQNLGTRQKV